MKLKLEEWLKNTTKEQRKKLLKESIKNQGQMQLPLEEGRSGQQLS